MSHRRQVWQRISDGALRLERESPLEHADDPDSSEIMQLLVQLGKAQYKANALFEAKLERQQETLKSLATALARQEEIFAHVNVSAREDTPQTYGGLLAAILPVLDGLENALRQGRRQLAHLDQADDAGHVLSGWLDGIGVIFRQMNDVLAQAGVEAIDTVGRRFDPHRHVATGIAADGSVPTGVVVSETVRGYVAGGRVLRYAEVVVSRPSGESPGGRFSDRTA